jgi:hypothetical protein
MNSINRMVWRGIEGLRKQVYVVDDLNKCSVGDTWMQGRLLVGDLVTPIKLTGDGFYDFQLIEGGNAYDRGYRGPGRYSVVSGSTDRYVYKSCGKGAVISGYRIGRLFEFQPTEEEWYTMMSGQYTEFSKVLDK